MAIKVGFVGAGGRARNHMRTLHRIKDVEIVAICDVNENTAKEATSEYGGRVYTDYNAMLEKEDLTAMYVVVPTFAHYDAEILAAQKGIHLMLEKPVAPSMEKAVEILDAVNEEGVDLGWVSTAIFGLGTAGASLFERQDACYGHDTSLGWIAGDALVACDGAIGWTTCGANDTSN